VGSGPEADIPLPIVDLAEATRTAKAALHARRADPDVKAGKKAIVDKHASRKHSNRKASPPTSTNTLPDTQLGFDF